MPPHIASTFTVEQLEAIRRAFGTRYTSRHLFEIKRRIWLPWGRFYLVIQFGRDQRDPVGPRIQTARGQ